METTITLECLSDTREHLRELEHELKQIHGLKVFFVEPRDTAAPVLISISVPQKEEQAELAIRRIAHTLFAFMHNGTKEPEQRKITLVTIEGESVDLGALGSDEIKQIITEAHAGQTG
jgi:hypothetical protein